MKGDIIEFDKQTKTGLISGEDGKRYSFHDRDWKAMDKSPKKGVTVDFERDDREGADEKSAMGVIPVDTARKPVSRTVFIIVGLFFGALGIHNFIAGYTYKAITQLLITVLSLGTLAFISWIWAVIEIITVTDDAHGADFV